MLWLVALLGCERRAPITTCQQDLSGEYVAGERRWAIVDRGAQLEVVPLFADVPVVPGLEVAPRWIDLERGDTGIAGFVRRRYMRAAATCTAKQPATITACANDAIDIVLADPSPPLTFAPCTYPRPAGSARERWVRR
ncbi:MAG: hypothetical protein ABI867_23590 [Kofleriaceae bacterium]